MYLLTQDQVNQLDAVAGDLSYSLIVGQDLA
ncbi:hypothetical protein FIU94_04570 [Sulfitobacter sp. THAF37]|nr:hypothetical protein FIU94_04570 [Sulfitobacter sp. THAF37]